MIFLWRNCLDFILLNDLYCDNECLAEFAVFLDENTEIFELMFVVDSAGYTVLWTMPEHA